MPPRPARPAATQKEPSYQIGIPLDGGDSSALQPSEDRFDQDDTAQDHPAPPLEREVSTEVTLPKMQPPASPSSRPLTAVSGRSSAVSNRSSAVSSRSAATRSSRSSRRTAATSVSVPKVSSRRVTVVDRAALQKALLWIGIGVLGAGVLITGIILWATHGSDDRRLGTEALAEAGRQYELVKTALANRRGGDARAAYDAALKALTDSPQLGGAVSPPPEGKPVVRELAVRASELRKDLEALGERVTAVQAEVAAASNLASLTARFSKLSDPETDIDALERDVLAFIDNPVEPKLGASPTHAQTFSRLVGEAKLRQASIVRERDTRKAARSAAPLRLAAVESEGLVKQEQFGEALAKLGEAATKNPDADFAPLRAQVEDAADKAWRSAKAQVETRLADWKSPGATEGQRKVALGLAKERLNQVIQRFGVPTYVDQARAMLTPLP